MRKIVSVILGMCLLLTLLTGCSEKLFSENKQESEMPSITEQKLEKYVGEIKDGTPFSEGLAIISDGQKTYCINKNGGIVFQLDYIYNPNSNGYYEKGYQNGLVKIGDNLYDKTGKETKPTDVGVTKFYDYALSGGYIVAEKQETTYNSNKNFLGIMNTKFEWIIPLNEELYQAAISLTRPTMYAYAVNGYIIDENSGYIFDVSASKMYSFEDAPMDVGVYGWGLNDSRWGEGSPEGKWIDGKHLVKFYNDSVAKYFFTLIDDTGKFLFEPVELTLQNEGWGFYWEYDGKHIVASAIATSNEKNIFVYDILSNSAKVSKNTIKNEIIYNDGVIVNYGSTVKYYDADLNPLF